MTKFTRNWRLVTSAMDFAVPRNCPSVLHWKLFWKLPSNSRCNIMQSSSMQHYLSYEYVICSAKICNRNKEWPLLLEGHYSSNDHRKKVLIQLSQRDAFKMCWSTNPKCGHRSTYLGRTNLVVAFLNLTGWVRENNELTCSKSLKTKSSEPQIIL